MTTRQKKIADLAAQVDSLTVRADAADRALVGDAMGRLFKGLYASLPPVPDDGLTEPLKYPSAPARFRGQLSSLDRIDALGARLFAGAGTEADQAVLAGMDAADLALIGYTASGYVQLLADVLGSF